MKLNPPNAHRSQIKICEKRQTQNVFRNTGANVVAKNQTRLAYEDKRDLYCMPLTISTHLNAISQLVVVYMTKQFHIYITIQIISVSEYLWKVFAAFILGIKDP